MAASLSLWPFYSTLGPRGSDSAVLCEGRWRQGGSHHGQLWSERPTFPWGRIVPALAQSHPYRPEITGVSFLELMRPEEGTKTDSSGSRSAFSAPETVVAICGYFVDPRSVLGL